jgi:hypothetical protein
VPQIAALFAIEVKPGAQAPRPLRPPRPKREFKRKPKVAKPAVGVPAADAIVVDAPAEVTPVADAIVAPETTVATVAPEAVVVTPVDASPAVETA